MNKINLKDKHLRYGGYSAFLTLIVTAIVILINILVTPLNLKIDTTSEKIYSLTDTTKEVVSHAGAPINLYVLESTGQETALLKEILLKYTKLNDQVHLIYKDPILYPTFGQEYLKKSNQNMTSLGVSTVIVENKASGKFKIVPASEFIESTSPSTGNNTALTVESAITNAIGYVLTDKDGKVYYTTGHNERTLSPYITHSCNRANLTTTPINLLTDTLPDPATSIIMIYSPHSDFTQEEVDKLIDFMNAGGKAFVFMDVDTDVLPIFNQFLSFYGVSHQLGLVVETLAKNMSSIYPTYLVPNKGSHTILTDLTSNAAPIIFPNSSAFTQLKDARTSLNITPLLTTSKDAFLRVDLSNVETTKQEGDIDGPLTLAYAIEDTSVSLQNPEGKTEYAKLVVVGDSYGLSSDFDVAATSNERFISSGLGWLLSTNTLYGIEGKSEDTYTLKALSTQQSLFINTFIVVVMPLSVCLLGFVICMRRRHS